MKTLLYKPLFINPQAYYVFPNINGRLEPKTGSGKEPAIFVGNIEVKTITYGDTSKKQYFYNTNEIDLSAFSGSLIRISLYTSRGNVVLGEWNLDVIEEEPGDYIDPKVLDSLCGVWIMDQNTNESESRNIIKNKIADRGGDLELLNFGYKLNSGYNGYATDFTEWSKYSNSNSKLGITASKVVINSANDINPSGFIIWLQGATIPEMRIRIKGIKSTTKVEYYYVVDGLMKYFIMDSDGIYNIPSSESYGSGVGFNVGQSVREDCVGLTIEQLPLYEGALVTDGKDDMIVSQKSFIDIVGSDNQPYTIVSMVSFIDNIHFYFNSAVGTETMTISYVSKFAIDKTHIFGYSTTNVQNNPNVINNILGDKNDYITRREPAGGLIGKEFSIQGYLRDGIPTNVSSVAVYWTFISNKVLTTDEINQIIGYFKLDKYVTPQVIYDVKRQGLTNDTPAADWYLKDFSGNGHDMQLYNYAKSKDSGIGKYELDFNEFTTNTNINTVLIEKNKDTFYAETLVNSSTFLIYKTIQANNTLTDTPSFKAKVEINKGATLQYRYINSDGVQSFFNITEEGEYEFPISYNNRYVNSAGVVSNGFVLGGKNTCRITQIPDYEGALVSDGKTDYGQFAGDLGLKDYTVVVDRAYPSIIIGGVPVVAGTTLESEIPFLFETTNGSSAGKVVGFSFGNSTVTNKTKNVGREITYQSTYKYLDANITRGNLVGTGDGLTIGRNRINVSYDNICLYSLMLFPYSLSEFLLERQLKKYKLGTLYPDMVEFRPIVKSNSEYQVVDFYIDNLPAVVGKYYPINSALRIAITTQGQVDEVSSIKVNGVDFGVPSVNGNRFTFNGTLSDKSPQKINITIDEYIRFEDIVQPYPEIWNITQNGNRVSWGDKLKVGSEFIIQSKTPLLPELYTSTNFYYNGNVVNRSTPYIVEKQMTFACDKTWKLNTTEPHAIYSPQKLNIPNSSLKILGYVPDLTGKGNHGKLNNFAYTEDSGVATDGSIKFDGTEDHAVNTVIPAVTDFTVIAKREWFDLTNVSLITKGSVTDINQEAFLFEYTDSAHHHMYSYGKGNVINSVYPSLISWSTKTNYNGVEIIPGNGVDTTGIYVGKFTNFGFWKGVFYKLMLYTKTIDQLSINMLKNLFERDELIDVTNPIFKKQ